MRKRTLPLSRVYRLLEPGPVTLVTTARRGRADIMAMSWHTMLEFEPPLVGCVISNRNHTFDILKATRECVINIPTVELAKKVVACGNSSGRRIDKFAAYHLTPVTASHVSVPLVDECYANFECRVVDARLVTKYNFFILEVVKAWNRSLAQGSAHDSPSRQGPLHGRGQEDQAPFQDEVALAALMAARRRWRPCGVCVPRV